MSLGRAILRVRQELGLTQEEVGQKAGLAPSYLSRIENDHIHPTMATLNRLAAALDLPVGQLLEIAEQAMPPVVPRCPVSRSGACIGDLIRSCHGPKPEGVEGGYTAAEIRILRMVDEIITSGSRESRGALEVILEAMTGGGGAAGGDEGGRRG